MTLKFTQLRTHFTPDDAYLILSFLGEISDALWAVYGDDIIQQQRNNPSDHIEPDLWEDIP